MLGLPQKTVESICYKEMVMVSGVLKITFAAEFCCGSVNSD